MDEKGELEGNRMGEIKYIYFPTFPKPILMSRRRQDPPFSPNLFPRCEIRKEL